MCRTYNLYPRVLKELAKELSGPLMIIFKQSWITEEVPADWKIAKLVPIFKKGKQDDLENCRQVSLTMTLGKILEG